MVWPVAAVWRLPLLTLKVRELPTIAGEYSLAVGETGDVNNGCDSTFRQRKAAKKVNIKSVDKSLLPNLQ